MKYQVVVARERPESMESTHRATSVVCTVCLIMAFLFLFFLQRREGQLRFADHMPFKP